MMNGVLNIYKEPGMTSFQVVYQIRKLTGEDKIGHTGTLDPDAKGVLPICIGKATKLVDLLMDTDKQYRASLLFGRKTDTQDVSGKTLEEMDPAEVKKMAEFPADAWLIGPGLGRSDDALQLVRDFIPTLTVPAVLDADALFAVCGYLRLLKNAASPLVITPHPGEMAKLLGVSVADVQANRVAVAEGFARQTNVVVVLKGAGTVVATPEGRIFINNTGNPGMATGGAGDVLAGMIATFLAQGMVPACAAACAVWLHGRAGDMAASEIGQAGVVAGDILEHVPAALKSIGR